MTDLQVSSAIWIATLIAFIVLGRRVCFSLSTYGVFVLANIVFVVAGLLLLPWAQDSIESVFTAFRLDRISPASIRTAMALNVSGLLLTYVGYQAMHIVATRGNLVKVAPNLLFHNLKQQSSRTGFGPRRVVLAALLVVTLGWATIVLRWPIFLHGLRDGILASRPDVAFDARRAATAEYGFVILAYNIAPFVSVALYALAYTRRSLGLWILAWATMISAGIYLLLVFQKRPLIVYLAALAAMRMWLKRAGPSPKYAVPRFRPHARLRRVIRFAIVCVTLFVLLMVLYYGSTRVGRSGEQWGETVWLLAQIAIQRVFGRLALPAAMYAEYFPGHAPHYGLHNIGLVATLLGTPLYRDTGAVFDYFTVGNAGLGGSVASSALNDFYGAFGLGGWALGALALGGLLNRIDLALSRLDDSVAKTVLVIFALVFAYYLSQASLARSLAGYGGLFFLTAWWALTVASTKKAGDESFSEEVLTANGNAGL